MVYGHEHQRKLRVGYLPLLSNLPLIIAYERGRLSFQTIEIELERYESYTALEAAFKVGAIDIAYIPVPIVISLQSQGHQFEFGKSLHKGGYILLENATKRTEDLTTIGIPSIISSEHLLLYDSLKQRNARYGMDYKVATVAFGNSGIAFRTGDVDQLLYPGPIAEMIYLTADNKSEFKLQRLSSSDLSYSTLAYNFTINSPKYNDAKNEITKQIKHACDYLDENLKKSNGLQIALLQKSYFGIDEQLFTSILSGYKNKLEFKFTDVPEQSFIKTQDAMLELSMILGN